MNRKFYLELLWWVFTVLAVIVVLFPIYTYTPNYPFYFINAVFVITFITLTRYTFLLKLTFLAKQQALKVFVFFLCIPLVFYLVQELNYFQTFLDEQGVEAVVGTIPLYRRESMMQYIRNEILLFSVGSIIGGVALPFRLLASIWSMRNRGTV